MKTKKQKERSEISPSLSQEKKAKKNENVASNNIVDVDKGTEQKIESKTKESKECDKVSNKFGFIQNDGKLLSPSSAEIRVASYSEMEDNNVEDNNEVFTSSSSEIAKKQGNELVLIETSPYKKTDGNITYLHEEVLLDRNRDSQYLEKGKFINDNMFNFLVKQDIKLDNRKMKIAPLAYATNMFKLMDADKKNLPFKDFIQLTRTLQMEGNIDPSGPIIFPVCDSGHFVAIHKLEDDKEGKSCFRVHDSLIKNHNHVQTRHCRLIAEIAKHFDELRVVPEYLGQTLKQLRHSAETNTNEEFLSKLKVFGEETGKKIYRQKDRIEIIGIKGPQQDPLLNACGFYTVYNMKRIYLQSEDEHQDNLQIIMDKRRSDLKTTFKKLIAEEKENILGRNETLLSNFNKELKKCNVNAQSKLLTECTRMLEIEQGPTDPKSSS